MLAKKQITKLPGNGLMRLIGLLKTVAVSLLETHKLSLEVSIYYLRAERNAKIFRQKVRQKFRGND